MSDIFSKKRSYDYAPRQKIDVEKAQTYDKGFWESYRDSRDFQTYAGNSYSREDNLHDEYEKEIENINVNNCGTNNAKHSYFFDSRTTSNILDIVKLINIYSGLK